MASVVSAISSTVMRPTMTRVFSFANIDIRLAIRPSDSDSVVPATLLAGNTIS